MFKVLFIVLSKISLHHNQRVGTFIGWLATVIPNRNYRITKINIEHCFPELTAQQQHKLIHDSLVETGKTTTEVAPMWLWNKQRVLNTIIKVNGEECLKEAFESGKGVILAFPHLGNWELLSLYCASRYPMTTLYQPPKLQQLDNMVRHGRERTGARLVATDNTGVKALLTALKNGEMIGILPDQEPKFGNGEFAPFFNIQAYTGTLISRMIKKTSAIVVFAYAKRLANGQGYELNFSPAPKDVYSDELSASVSGLNQGVENCVKELPEQYQWSYYRFRTRPEGEEKFYK
ncbi:MAG: lysophospholipid acyltransferase family protein [Gammaproteobacteria bacterium]